MPLMNGFEFLKRVTIDLGPKFSALIVIMLTSSLSQADAARAKEFGFIKTYFDKPLNIKQLERVASWHKH